MPGSAVRGTLSFGRVFFSFEGSALLVIDMQRFFIDPSSHASFPQAEQIIDNVQQVLAAFSCLPPSGDLHQACAHKQG